MTTEKAPKKRPRRIDKGLHEYEMSEDIYDDVYMRNTRGMSLKQALSFVKEKHNISCSDSAFLRAYRRKDNTRRELAKEALREKLSKDVQQPIDQLKRHIQICSEWAVDMRVDDSAKDYESLTRVLAELVKVYAQLQIATSNNFSAKADAEEQEKVLDSILKKVNTFNN